MAEQDPSGGGKYSGLLLVAGSLLLVAAVYRSGGYTSSPSAPHAEPVTPAARGAEHRESSAPSAAPAAGLAAPIAAAHLPGGDVVVAALDPAGRAVRVQRVDAAGAVVKERSIFDGAAGSPDAELKVMASGEGVGVVFRGLRAGKLVRQLAVLGPDLAPKGQPSEIAAASCATRDAFWWSAGSDAIALPWTGAIIDVPLPREKDASLLCGQHRAFAVLEDEDRTSVMGLGGDAAAPAAMMRESDFGEDDQRELAEYTAGDDVGFVRLSASGALAVRELAAGGSAGPLHRLKSTIRRDDDVVAVDASSRFLLVVYTEEVPEGADAEAPSETAPVCTKVGALRVDRQTWEESSVELSPGRCGHEVGPFFTGAVGESISVAWPERAGGAGAPRAPIVGLAHALVGPTGTPELRRIAEAADAFADAGCDAKECRAVALTPASPASPASVRVLRF